MTGFHISDAPRVSHLVEPQMSAWEATRRRWAELSPPVRRAEVADFVCVSRVFGAGGADVARALGRRLGWPVFDKELLVEMAGSDEIRKRLYESLDERDTNWLEEFLEEMVSDPPSKEEYFHRLSETVLALARQGHAVFLGRAVDLILPRRAGLRVRIAAPKEFCIKRYAERHGIGAPEARKTFERIEHEREGFIRRHFGIDAYEPTRHDLVVNLERFKDEEAVELILAAMRLRGILPAG